MSSSTDDKPLPGTIRLATPADDAFILGLVDRFVDFELPAWRRAAETRRGIDTDLRAALAEPEACASLVIAENDRGEPAAFMRLQLTTDFFTGSRNCHIADLAVSPQAEGTGVASALLEHAEDFAREHGCRHMTLAVFPGNERARQLYERRGYGLDLLRMAKPLR